MVIGALLLKCFAQFLHAFARHGQGAGNAPQLLRIVYVSAVIVADNVAVKLHGHELFFAQPLGVEGRLHGGQMPGEKQ